MYRILIEKSNKSIKYKNIGVKRKALLLLESRNTFFKKICKFSNFWQMFLW